MIEKKLTLSELKPGMTLTFRDWNLLEEGRKSGLPLSCELVRVFHLGQFIPFWFAQIKGDRWVFFPITQNPVILEPIPGEGKSISSLKFPGSGKVQLARNGVAIE